MKSMLLLFSAVSALALSAEVPYIDSQVTLDRPAASSWATITYTLKGAPAIVTLDIETNTLDNAVGEWVSIGGENVQTLVGDVNKIVTKLDEPSTIRWKATVDWPERVIKTGRTRAVLTLWETNAPPDYLVIGLEKRNDVRFYASTNFIPYGIGSDYYRTNAIVMRKIPAEGVHWMMGSPDDEDGRVAEREIRHGVVFSEDYYMGIYELTQGQIASSGYTEFYAGFTNYEDSPLCPADALHMQNLRGCDSHPTSSKKWWPQSGHTVTSGSIIGVLRAKCGLGELDLPTESQWEYACRAGTSTPYNLNTGDVPLGDFCWYKANTSSRPKPVGKLVPNAWGLYDMHGNVSEWCLDRLTLTNDYTKAFPPDYALRGVVIDPVGGELCTTVLHSNGKDWMNNQVVNRGGSWYDSAAAIAVLRSAHRSYGTFNTATKVRGPTSDKEGSFNGARLCHPARFK